MKMNLLETLVVIATSLVLGFILGISGEAWEQKALRTKEQISTRFWHKYCANAQQTPCTFKQEEVPLTCGELLQKALNANREKSNAVDKISH